MLPLLADAAIQHAHASGAAVLELRADGTAHVAVGRNLCTKCGQWNLEVETVDAELGERMMTMCDGRFKQALTLPLMSGGNVFGALVLFYTSPTVLEGAHRVAAEDLAEMGGLSLDAAQRFADLAKSNAELRASRAALEKGQKLRALGEMAAGVSHDLKNILNPLSLHLQLVERSLKRGQTAGALEAVGEMHAIVRRGTETLERLRDFSRQSTERALTPCDVDVIVREAIEIAKPRIASGSRARGVRMYAELGGPPPILAQSGDLVAALVNLLVNAIDALVEGGTVTVTTAATPEGGAWVRVADDGPGMPEAVRARVFEPFFTTKGQSGTGLGLPMVYAFAKRHGATVAVDTEPGAGAAFTLTFPPASAPPPPVSRPG